MIQKVYIQVLLETGLNPNSLYSIRGLLLVSIFCMSPDSIFIAMRTDKNCVLFFAVLE